MAEEARAWVFDPVSSLWVPSHSGLASAKNAANVPLVHLAARDGAGTLEGIRTAAADGATANLQTAVLPLLFNGTTADRERGVEASILLASAVRAASLSTAIQTNYNHRGVVISIRVTANPGGAETLTVGIHGDDAGGNAFNVLQQITLPAATNGMFTLTCYPGATTAPGHANNSSYGNVLPRRWHAFITHSAAGNWTYQVEASVIP